MDKNHECRKCKQSVPPENSVNAFSVFLAREIEPAKFYPDWGKESPLPFGDQHLFPIAGEDKAVCEGSPSRAQYLPDGQLDSRLDMDLYEPSLRDSFMRAFEAYRIQFPEKR